MHALDHQETSACILIYFCKCGWIKLCWIPISQYFLVADLRWMTVFFNMIVICSLAGLIEFTCIPVATLASRLWAKVNPDAEFRLAKPCRFAGIILLDRFPCWL